jgi:predicted N-acetyltransferase YhbS
MFYSNELIIRQETPEDYLDVFKVIEQAFREEKLSDYAEHFLVQRLRVSKAFIPELSIIAEYRNEIVGHILLTRIQIKNKNQVIESLALAPVSVKPEFQYKGIGGLLINKAHKKAKELGFKTIILLGHENYYPKFGYELTSKYNIKFPFEAPEQNCMIFSLTKNGLDDVSGTVEYPKEFSE